MDCDVEDARDLIGRQRDDIDTLTTALAKAVYERDKWLGFCGERDDDIETLKLRLDNALMRCAGMLVKIKELEASADKPFHITLVLGEEREMIVSAS